MADSKLKAYREKLFTDLYTNIIPDRVPVYDGFGYEFFAQINGRSLLESEYNFTLESVKSQIDDVMKFAQGDYVAFAPRNPYPIFFKQSLTEMVSNTGMQQHPEVEVMQADEYDKIIKDPFGFSAEELIYRNAQAYSKDDPVAFGIAVLRTVYQSQDFAKVAAAAGAYLKEEYDFFPNPPAGTGGYQLVPFDLLADRNRGFSAITKDIKRQPQKILDAMDALMPYCIDRASKSKLHPLGSNQTMTHMAAFLRTSEFEKFYWKHFNELVHISAERGSVSMTGRDLWIICKNFQWAQGFSWNTEILNISKISSVKTAYWEGSIHWPCSKAEQKNSALTKLRNCLIFLRREVTIISARISQFFRPRIST